MDIIVTTPKSQMKAAAQEAADCIAAGGGEYFRRFALRGSPSGIQIGDRIYYVEDGYIRGFADVKNFFYVGDGLQCDTTGRRWPKRFCVFMDAKTWRWIEPIPMRGFQGFRYADNYFCRGDVRIVGYWRDPKPEVKTGTGD